MRGIDVAKWNTITDYSALLSQGIEFGIVKVINKQNNPDGGFARHIAGFAGAGIPVIAGYNYLYATTAAAAILAAKACIKTADGKIPLIVADIEDKVLKNLSKNRLVSVITEYRKVIEDAGLKFAVYCSLDWYKNVIDVDRIQAPFWIARYGKNNGMFDPSYKPSIRHDMYGWQWSSRVRFAGITGDVDINEWYADTEAEALGNEVSGYEQTEFIREMAQALGIPEHSTGKQVLERTVTISTKSNRTHPCVTALERYMKQIGYYSGRIEADLGRIPVYGNGMAKATVMYQQSVVGLRKPDAVWTAGKNSYRKALGVS